MTNLKYEAIKQAILELDLDGLNLKGVDLEEARQIRSILRIKANEFGDKVEIERCKQLLEEKPWLKTN